METLQEAIDRAANDVAEERVRVFMDDLRGFVGDDSERIMAYDVILNSGAIDSIREKMASSFKKRLQNIAVTTFVKAASGSRSTGGFHE